MSQLSLCKLTRIRKTKSRQQPHPQYRIPRQPHRQTKDYYRTINTTQAHRHSSKSERNLIILQVNINGIKNKLEELKLLIRDTHADIITIRETNTPPPTPPPTKAKTQQCATIGCTRQEVGSSHSLETT